MAKIGKKNRGGLKSQRQGYPLQRKGMGVEVDGPKES